MLSLVLQDVAKETGLVLRREAVPSLMEQDGPTSGSPQSGMQFWPWRGPSVFF